MNVVFDNVLVVEQLMMNSEKVRNMIGWYCKVACVENERHIRGF
jgi:hypothetical protein